MKKYTVFDYLDWRGELNFLQSELNEIDALIFSILSYLDYSYIENEPCTFAQAFEKLESIPDEMKYDGLTIMMHSVMRFAKSAAETNRFKNIIIYDYVDQIDEKKEMQFAAVTFLLPDQTAFIAFRGTDNTIVGWKEDFNMSFMNGIPAQMEAAKYVNHMIGKLNCPFRLGGHSKGGNLSIWAGAHLCADQKEKLLQIYSNDGPGFNEEFLKSERYLSVREKIRSFVPEASIVGVIMAHDDYVTIGSSNASILQHDPFSWLLLGSNFITIEKRSKATTRFEKIINSWLESLSKEEREQLVDNIYDILTSSNAKTIDDLDKNKLKALYKMQKTFSEMGVKKQAQLLFCFNKIKKKD